MGEKIEFYFLSDCPTKKLLNEAISALQSLGWTYNEFIRGQYTYWLNSPMYFFEESKTVKEREVGQDLHKISLIIEKISEYYSPSIILGSNWLEKNLSASLSIVEADFEWKWLIFAIDRFGALDSFQNSLRPEAKKKISDLFLNLAIEVKPYYGIGGTEVYVNASNPNALHFQNLFVGDFCYFSKLARGKLKNSETKDEFIVKYEADESLIFFRRKDLLELG